MIDKKIIYFNHSRIKEKYKSGQNDPTHQKMLIGTFCLGSHVNSRKLSLIKYTHTNIFLTF